MNLPGITRKSISQRFGVGEKQVRRYIKLASEHIQEFKDFVDPTTNKLNGTPIETEQQVKCLENIRKLLKKYKNSKNKSELIAAELRKIHESENNQEIHN